MASNSGYRAFVFMGLLIVLLLGSARADMDIGGKELAGGRPCEEIYVVGEGETLHTISAKCGDPFIVEENPQIQDSDDVYPGLVIKITPSLNSRKLLLS